MRCITLSGASFIFDKDDYDLVKQYTWHTNGNYATTNGKKGQGNIYAHKLIAGANIGVEVDHVNLDKLDNRRNNLRIATHTQNNYNKKLGRNNSTGYKGVCFHKQSGLYLAYITVEKHRIYLGLFHDSVSAAHAYDRAAKKYHGEFAFTNQWDCH